mgnify:FL=1
MEPETDCQSCINLKEKFDGLNKRITDLLAQVEPINLFSNSEEALEIPNLYGSVNISIPKEIVSSHEAEYLRTLILGLNQKLKLVYLSGQETHELKNLTSKSEQQSKDVLRTGEETYTQLRQNCEDHTRSIKEIEEQLQKLDSELKQLTEFDSQLDSESKSLEEKIHSSAPQELSSGVFEEMFEKANQMRLEMKQLDKDLLENFTYILKSCQEFSARCSDSQRQTEKLNEDNSKLRKELEELQKQVNKEKAEEYSLVSEQLNLKGELESLKAQLVLEEDEYNYLSKNSQVAEFYNSQNQNLNELLNTALNQYQNRKQVLLENDHQIKAAIEELIQEINYTSNEISKQNELIKNLAEEKNTLEKVNLNLSDRIEPQIGNPPALVTEVNDLAETLSEVCDNYLVETFKLNLAKDALSHYKEMISKTTEEINSIKQEYSALEQK